MPRFVAEGVETISPIIIKELRISQGILVKEKEVLVKEYMMQSGTINFTNSKKAIITFERAFEKVPRITLTLSDMSVTNPYTTNINKTGFTVNFINPWTGNLDWIALER